jgi:hypothetical protein
VGGLTFAGRVAGGSQGLRSRDCCFKGIVKDYKGVIEGFKAIVKGFKAPWEAREGWGGCCTRGRQPWNKSRCRPVFSCCGIPPLSPGLIPALSLVGLNPGNPT